MRFSLFLLLATAAFPSAAVAATPQEQVAAVLDDWHQAASVADEPRYFGHFAPNGVFMGTDGTERWTVAEFRAWAKPHFDAKKAWSFKAKDRHIDFSPDGQTAWVDEALDTPNLGPSRGTAVLVHLGDDWKIAQYNLSIPIPNALSDSFVKRIADAANPDLHYHLGPDSLDEPGVPKGELRGPFTLPSEAYPGTQHTYWVYVPAQYDPAVPASLTIFNDGQAFMNPEGDLRARNVMDNLIYRREIPVMIGVFINPGRRPDQPEPDAHEWGDKTTNRPQEYNALDDKYPRVIVDELLPALNKDYNISKNPDDRAIGGASSGGIAALTVAWQRTEQFHKVFTIVGSFTNIRGGNAYPDIVRKADRKPIRIFLQDGRNDNRGLRRGGAYDESWDWFLQNTRMVKALTDKGYEVNYAFGMNKHGSKMGGAILPEMMRWLWRDQPVSTDPKDMVERGYREAVTRK